MKDQRIRLIFTNKVYKKKGNYFYVPIVFENGRYLTGQPDVKIEEAKREVPVRQEMLDKYGYIINPNETYRVTDLKWFDLTNPMDNAILKLIKMSGKIAQSKEEYNKNKGRYDGYLEDLIEEAKVNNVRRTIRYEAETEVLNATIDDLIRTALLLNYKVKSFQVNPGKLTKEELLDRILNIVDSNPSVVKTCFSKYNPNISYESFGVELLHYNILKRDRSGSIYEGEQYICETVESLRDFISNKGNSNRVDKWSILLKEAKSKSGVNITSPEMLSPERVFAPNQVDAVNQVKVALFDDNLILANQILHDASRISTPSQIDEMKQLINAYTEKKQSEVSKNLTEPVLTEPVLTDELELMTVEQLQEVIKANKFKSWKLSDLDNKDDKNELMEYIKTKRKQ